MMDDKSILLMSEELRAALGEKGRVEVERQQELPGRWSRSFLPPSTATEEVPGETIWISGNVVRCSAQRSGGTRLIVDLVGPSDDLSRLTSSVESQVVTHLIVGSCEMKIDLKCKIRSARIDGGAIRRVSLLVDLSS